MKKKSYITAILLLGGSGKRFNHEIPKQFQLLQDKKIYLHTLETFRASHLFQTIILVCHSEWVQTVKEESFPYHPVVIPGGKTRQESSYLGLLACPPETDAVVIHDAVRPFVSHHILEEHIRLVKLYGAVNTCIPSSDTVVCTLDGNTIDSIPLRSSYWRGQTPQSFRYADILHAHKSTKKQEATDDCSLILEQGKTVHIALGSEANLKITTSWDLLFAEKVLARSAQPTTDS